MMTGKEKFDKAGLRKRLRGLTPGQELYFKRTSDDYGWGLVAVKVLWETYLFLMDFATGDSYPICLSSLGPDWGEICDECLCHINRYNSDDSPFYVITKEEAEDDEFVG